MLLAAAVLAVVWPLRDRLRTPVAMVWLVLGLFSFGCFFEFFLRSDSEQVALGLNSAQWTSLVLVAGAVLGATVTTRRRPRASPAA